MINVYIIYLVGFAIEYTVNDLFYNDDTMHKIYESKGQFDLETQFLLIYRNTQFHLFKDILMSLGLSLLIPFVVYLIPGIFRIPALSHKKNKRVCLYNFSKLLQGI